MGILSYKKLGTDDYDNNYVNINISNNKSIATYQKLFNSRQKNADEIVCIDYSTVVDNPMLMKGEYNSDHLGIIGVYQISPLKY